SSTRYIHPSSKGDEFTVSGESSSESLTSVMVPETGAMRSETLFVLSTSPQDSPEVIESPTAGRSTYTTSPSCSWAKSVIPTRTTASSSVVATHSWSREYRKDTG